MPSNRAPISYEQLNRLLLAAYKAGFMASQQGWNGRIPFANRDPATSQKWVQQANANLTKVINEVLPS